MRSKLQLSGGLGYLIVSLSRSLIASLSSSKRGVSYLSSLGSRWATRRSAYCRSVSVLGFLYDPLYRRYDVAPDGQSFAVILASKEAATSPPTIRVVLNWFAEFQDRGQD